MSKRAKHFCVVLGAQTACVAVGLWMYHHFVVQAAGHAVEQQAWQALDDAATRLDRQVAVREGVAPPDEGASDETLERTYIAAAAPPTRVLRVDAHGRLALPPDAGPVGGPGGASAAARPVDTGWVPLDSDAPRGGPHVRGTLTLSGEPYFGVATPLPDADAGVLIVCRPVASVRAGVAGITGSFLQVAGMTLLWTCAMLGIGVYLIISRLQDDMDTQRLRKSATTLRRAQTLVRTRDAIIFGLAKLADSRDPETGEHLERISAYSTTLASALRRHPRFCDRITPTFVRLIGISSALHDIGKVGIVDRILLKPGPLNDEERTEMQEHCVIGGDCLREIEQRLGTTNFLQMAREIAMAHHERWDGTGYPLGLKGERIPLSARIVAIADVYDALSSKRVYKDAFEHERCVQIIRDGAGSHFDSDLVDMWLKIETKFRDIARQYGRDIDASRVPVPVRALLSPDDDDPLEEAVVLSGPAQA